MTSTGPPSPATGSARIGTGQCAEGERSSVALPSSFQGQVAAMPARAPAAAISSVPAMPTVPASQPQTMLPSAMLPKNTARLTASPRERTQPGSAIWAETFRLESTAIQASPASTQAGNATGDHAGTGQQRHHQRQRRRAQRHGQVGTEARLQRRQQQRAGHRAGADTGQQRAVEAGAARQRAACEQWQERPERAAEQEEAGRADERGAQLRAAAGVAQARADGGEEALGGQRRGRLRLAAPEPQGQDHGDEAHAR